jgi:cytochrome c5
MKPLLFSLLFLVVIAVGCSTSKKSASVDKNANKVETAALSAELQQGHDLFVNNCGKCHKLPDPASRQGESWKKVMNVMAPKSKLDQAQADLIYNYLVRK